ncbi:hypothetical protein ABIB90_007188 [Bradyrhizobium sp. JR4.1]
MKRVTFRCTRQEARRTSFARLVQSQTKPVKNAVGSCATRAARAVAAKTWTHCWWEFDVPDCNAA